MSVRRGLLATGNRCGVLLYRVPPHELLGDERVAAV